MTHDDLDLDKYVAELRGAEGVPRPAPREKLWAAIEARRARRRRVVRPRFGAPRLMRVISWAAAAAAVLVAGIFLGRQMSTPTQGPTTETLASETQQDIPVEASPYAFVTLDLLGRADALLTDFRSKACGDEYRLMKMATWADGLLAETRLLLSAPDLDDPDMKRLLADLELTLAQMSRLTDERCASDSEWIRSGLKERDTVRRLRTVAATQRDRTTL